MQLTMRSLQSEDDYWRIRNLLQTAFLINGRRDVARNGPGAMVLNRAEAGCVFYVDGAALVKAGNKNYHVGLVPESDHNIIVSETGCLEEKRARHPAGRQDYPPQYLDTIEEWLQELRN